MSSEFFILSKDDAEKFLSGEAFAQLTQLSGTINPEKVARAIRVGMFEANEMSVSDFREQYGCSKAFVSNLRGHGTSSINVIEKVAKVLNLSVIELLKLGEK